MRQVEPFALTPDTRAYVRRPATEAALASLETALSRSEGVAVLAGPPGSGRTLLLRLLMERLDACLRTVYVPYPSLSSEDLARWVLSTLGESAEGEPQAGLRASAARAREAGSALVLVVDDADALPPRTAEDLARWVREEPGLRLLVAVSDDREKPVLQQLREAGCEVRLDAPMTPEETRRYVEARLARHEADGALCAAFDRDTVDELHRLSEGVPARLHVLADGVIRRMREAPARAARRTMPPREPEQASLQEAPATGTSASKRAASRWGSPQPAVVKEPSEGVQRPATGVAAPTRRRQAERRPAAPSPAASARATRAQTRAREARERLAWGATGWVVGAAMGALAIFLLAAPEAPQRAAEETARTAPPLADEEEIDARSPTPATAEPGQPGLPGAATQRGPAAAAEAPLLVHIEAAPWTSIQIDGAPAGEAPLADVPLRPGPHRFVATLPDGRVVERVIVVSPTNRRVSFPATESAP